MLPILLCVVGWGWSGMQATTFYYSLDGRWMACGHGQGVVYVQLAWDGRIPVGRRIPVGWLCLVSPVNPIRFWPTDQHNLNDYNLLGFYYCHNHYVSSYEYTPEASRASSYSLGVPYWFLIAVFSWVLFIVWRKTRPKLHPPSAFPVEIAAATNLKQTRGR